MSRISNRLEVLGWRDISRLVIHYQLKRFCWGRKFITFSLDRVSSAAGIRLIFDCFYWPSDDKIEGVSSWFGRGISISWIGLTQVDVIPFPFTLVHSLLLTYPLNLDYDIRRKQGDSNLAQTWSSATLHTSERERGCPPATKGTRTIERTECILSWEVDNGRGNKYRGCAKQGNAPELNTQKKISRMVPLSAGSSSSSIISTNHGATK